MTNEFERRFGALIRDFEDHYPSLVEQMVDWYPSGRMEITILIDDGRRLTYNGSMHTLRVIHDPHDDSEYIDDEKWRKEFSAQFRRKLSTTNLTQEDISELTGISKVMLSKYRQGKATPSGTNLCKLARALECTVSELAEFK